MLDYLKSGRFIETIIVIIFGAVFIAACNALDKKYFKTKAGNTKWYKSSKMIIDFINSIVVLILILAVLSINGVNVGKYVKSLGVLGIIMSFALQDLLKDVIMGLSIMFEGYYKVGDVIIYDGRYGKVISFNVKTTRVFMLDDESTLSICNRNINSIAVASDWVDIDIPIGYDVDLVTSRNLCRECAKRIERLRYVYSCDFANTQELAESWVNYRLRIHCLCEKRYSVRRNAQAVIQDVFYEHNQEFPLSIKVLYNMEPTTNENKTVAKVESISGENTTIINTSSHKRKYDYELGRGAAKSKVIAFDGSDDTVRKAINEAERYAVSENLSNSMKLRLRLISEELLMLTKSIPQLKDGSFYIERDGIDYDICFDASGKISKKTRTQLVGVSSSNTNDAYIGISGLFTKAIDSMVQMSINDKSGVNSAISKDTMEESIGKADDDYKWSYNIYKEKEQNATVDMDEDASADIKEDEIGKSMLMKLSDDIRISVRTNHVSMRVLVKAEDEDE